jgi:long-chain acyl-CoA synthetase
MSSRTVFRLLEETAERYGDAPALHQPYSEDGQRKFRTLSWNQYRAAALEIACGLRALGIGKGDIVALNSETRLEFYLADLGVMAAGAVAAAMYPSYPAKDQVRTIRNCDAKAVFVETPKQLPALAEAGVAHWILLTGEAPGAVTLDELRASGRRAIAADPELPARLAAEVQAADPAVLYLTSGATGEPKMVLVTHAALVANADMAPYVFAVGPRDRTIAFLPSAHIAQRVVMELVPLRCGMPVTFSQSLMSLPQEIKALKPTILLAPPRLWERIYATICTELKKKPAVAQKAFYGALGLGLAAARYRRRGQRIPARIRWPLAWADRLIFHQIRLRLGGSIRIAASGAAPLGAELAEFYEAIGMPLIEGYGLTEGGVASFNPVDKPRPGSIGKALPGVDVRVGADGELLIKSPCLFTGYYKDAATTAEVLRDGWLHTGDVASIDEEGYIFITGRKKEMIIASNGKKIFPARLENMFKFEPLISQVLLVGDRLPYISALLTLNASAAEALDGMKGRPVAELAAARPVLTEIQKIVARINKQLAPFEQVRKFRVLERDFSIEEGELTATMKVRRDRVIQNFRLLIDELYAGKEESH